MIWGNDVLKTDEGRRHAKYEGTQPNDDTGDLTCVFSALCVRVTKAWTEWQGGC